MNAQQMITKFKKTENVRNISVIAHVDHGKTTLVDSLLARAGLIKSEDAGRRRMMDTKQEEQDRQITIKSTGISLHFTREKTQENYMVNLVDSPGHVDFSSEVTAALRITDGALVVVDCIGGVCVQTETVTRQAMTERIKPVLHINKVDRGISELKLTPEDLYQKLNSVIISMNSVLEKYQDESLGDVIVDPRKGTVSFGSGKQGWAFTLPMIAQMMAKKTGQDEYRLLNRLWGEHYFDPATKRIVSTSTSPKTGEPLQRYVCKVILQPLINVFQTIGDGDIDKLQNVILPAIGVTITKKEIDHLTPNDLLSRVLQRWLPAGDALVDMIIDHLPSPIEAQKYRVANLYTGPMDDEVATAIRNCDPNGPLTMFISKMVPNSDATQFFAFGRVFSGTLRPQTQVYVMGGNYIAGSKADGVVKIPRVVLMMGRNIENTDEVQCGFTAAVTGVDSILGKSGTLSSVNKGYPIAPMKFSVSPVVRQAVRPTNPSQLAQFLQALKKLSKSDPCLQVINNDKTGESVIAGAGELHIEVALNDLREFLPNNCTFTVSQPIVEFCETVTTKSSFVCLAKSKNKHNRLYVTAEPLDEAIIDAIDSGELEISNQKQVVVTLTTKFGWSKANASRVWFFDGSNCVIDNTYGVQYLREAKDHIERAFRGVCSNGALAGEQLRGVCFNIEDAKLHSDPPHRSASQVSPAAKKAFKGAQLSASPALVEPYFLAEMQTEMDVCSKIHALVSQRRGFVIDEQPKEGSHLYIVKAHIPVLESFGFAAALGETTSGRAIPQLIFSHWAIVNGDPLKEGSLANGLLKDIRERKQMKKELPNALDFNDKL